MQLFPGTGGQALAGKQFEEVTNDFTASVRMHLEPGVGNNALHYKHYFVGNFISESAKQGLPFFHRLLHRFTRPRAKQLLNDSQRTRTDDPQRSQGPLPWRRQTGNEGGRGHGSASAAMRMPS